LVNLPRPKVLPSI